MGCFVHAENPKTIVTVSVLIFVHFYLVRIFNSALLLVVEYTSAVIVQLWLPQLTKKQSSLQGRRRKWNKEQTKVIIRLIDVFCRVRARRSQMDILNAAQLPCSRLSTAWNCAVKMNRVNAPSKTWALRLSTQQFDWHCLSQAMNSTLSLSFFFYPPVAPGLCLRGRSEQSLYSYSLFFVRLLISLPLFQQWHYTNIHLHS